MLIGHVDLISDMRRDLIGEGKLSGPPARALQQIGNQSNPYGRPNSDRLAWAEGLGVPTVESNPNFDYLSGSAAPHHSIHARRRSRVRRLSCSRRQE